jgi:hypothetical protein
VDPLLPHRADHVVLEGLERGVAAGDADRGVDEEGEAADQAEALRDAALDDAVHGQRVVGVDPPGEDMRRGGEEARRRLRPDCADLRHDRRQRAGGGGDAREIHPPLRIHALAQHAFPGVEPGRVGGLGARGEGAQSPAASSARRPIPLIPPRPAARG